MENKTITNYEDKKNKIGEIIKNEVKERIKTYKCCGGIDRNIIDFDINYFNLENFKEKLENDWYKGYRFCGEENDNKTIHDIIEISKKYNLENYIIAWLYIQEEVFSGVDGVSFREVQVLPLADYIESSGFYQDIVKIENEDCVR